MASHASSQPFIEEEQPSISNILNVSEERNDICTSMLLSNSSTPILTNELIVDSVPELSITQKRLAGLVQINGRNSLHNIVAALQTNIDTGILGDEADIKQRCKAFGSNLVLGNEQSSTVKKFSHLILEAFKDTAILLLLCCAALSLVIDVKRDGLAEGLVDGALVVLAIFFVVNFGVIVRFLKASARKVLKKSAKHKRAVLVVRNGKMLKVPESEVVVGDIVRLQAGDHVPADGLFIDGNSLQLDDGLHQEGSKNSQSFAIFSGAKVLGGTGRMLVISVGKDTERSKLLRSVSSSHQDSKLQADIDKANSKLEKVWLSLTLLLLIVQIVRCFVCKSALCDEDHNPDPKGVKNAVEDLMTEATKLMKSQGFKLNGLLAMLCVLIFASKDGLPLGIFISFFYAAKRMKSYQAIIQKLPACAMLGLVTTICVCDTHELALQHAKLAEFWVGLSHIDDPSRELDHKLLQNFQEGIFMNSSGTSESDISLAYWAQEVLGMDMLKNSCTVLEHEMPSIDRNLTSVLLEREDEAEGILHVHWKGAPELILSMCSHYYTADRTVETLDEKARILIHETVKNIASNSHHCFAFSYKELRIHREGNSNLLGEPDKDEEGACDDTMETSKPLEHGLIWLGLVGLKNPYAPETRQAIEAFRRSGVDIKLVVDDDINTARIMALYSGILKPEADILRAVIDAAEFRAVPEEDRFNMIDQIHIMANSSPSDKLLMLQCLKRKGKIVAATGSSIRDSPLLKEADVGIFVGEICPEVSKEDSDVLVINPKFSTVTKMLNLGRRVCKTLEKFIQLQLTLEISGFTINFFAIAAKSQLQLQPFQLLWVNLTMEILGALAIAITTIETPSCTNELKNELVYGQGPVITRSMFVNIALQASFQITFLLVMDIKGQSIFHVNRASLKSMIFILYFYCQLFQLITTMELEKNKVLEGLLFSRNCWFLAIIGIVGVLQIALVQVMEIIGHWAKLKMKEWWICVGIASSSVLINLAANCILCLSN